MRHGSLFSGIGGFDLAAEWMGWDNVFHCEWMPFPRQVLHYHFPKSISYEDITKTDFTIHRGSIDILTGGFPCQPYSSAGKRLGKEDERHLWPHMLRAIQEIEPTYVVGENVRGLTNWNGGVVFEEVCAQLEDCGYEVQPILLPACAIGAPHRRDRVWFVAYNNSARWKYGNIRKSKGTSSEQTICINNYTNGILESFTNSNNLRQHQFECDNEINTSEGREYALNDFNENVGQRDATNTDSAAYQTQSQKRLLGQKNSSKQTAGFVNDNSRIFWNEFPTQSPICGGDDGLPTQLDGITFPKWRAESIKGYGNAIVPQVAYEIFKVINQLHYDTIPR
jgi:DNA (cytosine-5)-methyltransferase 1